MAATKPITADSQQGAFLLALRAGDMAGEDLQERFGSNVYHVLAKLAKSGLVKAISVGRSNVWTLTPAGRDACPYRNPLAAPRADAETTAAAPPVAPPPENAMERPSRCTTQDARQPVSPQPASPVTPAPAPTPRARSSRQTAILPSTNPRALAAILAPVACAGDVSETGDAAPPSLPRLTAPRLSIDDAGALTVSQPGLGAFVLAPEAVARLGRFLGCFEAPEATP